ncbi:MAG: hypothetical protein ACP5OG_00700 [Candidatus Nanoarchaeia archaeon]
MELEKKITKEELQKKGFKVFYEEKETSILKRGNFYYGKFDSRDRNYERLNPPNTPKEIKKLIKKYGFPAMEF